MTTQVGRPLDDIIQEIIAECCSLLLAGEPRSEVYFSMMLTFVSLYQIWSGTLTLHEQERVAATIAKVRESVCRKAAV
jgi:hypothetical protein